MQAIVTKYKGPTNTRQAVIIASALGRRLYPSKRFDHALDERANHAEAARDYAASLEWRGEWIGGALTDTGDYVWVPVASVDRFTVNP